MKKFFVFLLVLVMVISAASCGKTSGTDVPDVSDTKKNEDKDDTPKGDSDGELIPATLFDLSYDPEVWTYSEEDDFYDEEDYSSIYLVIPDPDDEEGYLASVNIVADITDPEGFRDDLYDYGFDPYEYAENDAYDKINVGGVECLSYEGESWGEATLYYFGRVENAGATVSVDVSGADLSDSRIADLIEGLEFKLTDTGNVDAPWPWNGEPYSQTDRNVMAGTFSLDGKWIAIKDCIITRETFDHAVAAVGNTVYLLVDGVLKQYTYDGSSLSFEKDIALDGEYEAIQSTSDGSIWVSGFMNPLVCIKDGAKTASYDDLDKVAMHPSGTWGISWFSGNECSKISFSGAAVNKSTVTFPEVDTISELRVDDKNIYVSGFAADESGHKVFVYDHDGKLRLTLTDAEGEALGSVTFVTETANGFIGFDGNMREVCLWSADGGYIASVEDSDLFGTVYPWFCASAILDDGSILTVMTEDRADESAMELVAYNVKGF